jgi:acyl carrier protein
MTSNRLYQLIAKVMDVQPSEINDMSGPETIENWDSFNGLVLVDELENEFKIKFTLEETTNVKTVSDIKKHLANHNVVLDD